VKQPLAIVGASTRAAASSAVRAGFQPLAADLFADADLRQIATATRIRPYPEGLLDWLRAIEPPAWMYTGALENHPELVDQMGWIAPLYGNSGDVLERVRSPWELAHVLQSARLLFPETRRSSEGLPKDGSWLAKTYRGASGSGVRELSASNATFDNERIARAVYQQRVEGVSCAAVYLAADGAAELLGITRQLVGEAWLGAGGFQYCGSIGPWVVSEAARAALVRIGNVLSETYELIGLFGVDFILNGDEVWAIEVNPRYTASVEIVERFSGVRAVAEHVAACGGSANSASDQVTGSESSGGRFHGKAILYARQDVVISRAFGEYTLEQSMHTPWPELADVSPAGTPVDKGRPVVTVFAEGPSATSVEQSLRVGVAQLEQMLYDE
jgi:predicted ATP-grasp superfamily ATP-dependent carboligase